MKYENLLFENKRLKENIELFNKSSILDFNKINSLKDENLKLTIELEKYKKLNNNKTI